MKFLWWLRSYSRSLGWYEYSKFVVFALILWSLWSGAHGMVVHASAAAQQVAP